MRVLYIMPVALCLSACQPDPGGIEVRTVNVPVPMPCLPADKIPEEPPKVADTLTGDANADLPIVTSSALLLRAWGQMMEAALRACAKDTTSVQPILP